MLGDLPSSRWISLMLFIHVGRHVQIELRLSHVHLPLYGICRAVRGDCDIGTLSPPKVFSAKSLEVNDKRYNATQIHAL